MAAAYLCGAAGMICNGFHSDRQQEVALALRAWRRRSAPASLLVIALLLKTRARCSCWSR